MLNYRYLKIIVLFTVGLLTHFNFANTKEKQQKITFNTLFDSSNKSIDTSPPSPVYTSILSDVSEIYTNRFNQKFIKIKSLSTLALIPRLLYAEAEVTQAQFEAVMSFNPSKVKNPDFPVTNVSFNDISEYASKISTFQEVYEVFDRENWVKALDVEGKNRFHFGNDIQTLDEYAWTGANSENSLHIIRSLKSNSIGLYDMHGNVSELVSYKDRVELINCSYLDSFGRCLSTYHHSVTKDYEASHVGFRLMLTLFSNSEIPPEQQEAKIFPSIEQGSYEFPFLLSIKANFSPFQLVYTVDGSEALPESGLLCNSSQLCQIAITKNRVVRARLCKVLDPYDCPFKEQKFVYQISKPIVKPSFQSNTLSEGAFHLDWKVNTIDFSFDNMPNNEENTKIEAYLEIQGFANSPYLIRNGFVQLETRNKLFCKYEDLAQFREIKTRRSAFLYYVMRPKSFTLSNNSSLKKNIYAGLFNKFYIYTSGVAKHKFCMVQNIGKTVDYDDETSLEVE